MSRTPQAKLPFLAVSPVRPGEQATPGRPQPNRSLALEKLFRNLYQHWAEGPVPPVVVEFYPYTTIRHTMRLRDGKVLTRFSDALESAPARVQEAMLAILLSKLLGRRPRAEFQRRYRDWLNRAQTRRLANQIQATRGRVDPGTAQGRVFDLKPLFERLNDRFFEGQLDVQIVCWSRKKAKTRLGFYDPARRRIVINRRLDHPLVPEYVVSFVLYHEMLHAALGEECMHGRRYSHHTAFREAERKFPDYRRAQRFIRIELP